MHLTTLSVARRGLKHSHAKLRCAWPRAFLTPIEVPSDNQSISSLCSNASATSTNNSPPRSLCCLFNLHQTMRCSSHSRSNSRSMWPACVRRLTKLYKALVKSIPWYDTVISKERYLELWAPTAKRTGHMSTDREPFFGAFQDELELVAEEDANVETSFDHWEVVRLGRYDSPQGGWRP